MARRPAEPQELTLSFEAGLPVALNGRPLDPVALIEEVGSLAGRHGVGRIDLMEDRVVGIKSREIYECPAAVTLIAARRDLERTTTLAPVLRLKATLDQRFAELIYEGFWFSPLRDVLEAFNREAAKHVTGEVRLRLFKGSLTVVGRQSPHALYNHQLATYGAQDRFDHRAAEGFIQLLGLPLALHSALHLDKSETAER